MEIHILRDGKQIGPFTEETVQSLLKQGNILINDLAWSPGLDGWNPLHAVLYPAAQPPPAPTNATPPPMPPAAVASEPVEESPVVEAPAVKAADTEAEDPATPRQKAFLTFMSVPFSSDLSKNRAAHLVNDAMEDPKNSGRLRRWDEERLRLYPDLFADEIKARRENRSQQFFEICQGEGSEFFEDITKAHTQVLVGFLDVQYPNWDRSDHSAKYDYFFPAIAEKFPQLVKRNAKGRFKYPNGPQVATELRSPVAARAKSRKSPLSAIVRGIFIGGILLAAGYGALKLQQQGGIDAIKAMINKASEQAKAPSVKGTSKPVAASEGLKPLATPAAPAPASRPSGTGTPTLAQASPVSPAPKAAPSVPEPPPAIPAPAPVVTPPADATMAANTAPSAPSALPANVSLFDTTPPPAAPPASEPLTSTPSPAAVPVQPLAPQRALAKITKSTVVNLRFGTSTLRPGTPVQVLSSSGTSLTIKFGPETATIPMANTDYDANLSMAPAPPGQ